MKKRGATLLILTLAFGLLIGGYYLVGALSKEESKEDVTPLLSISSNSLQRLSLTYNGSSITLLQDDDGWMLEDEPSFPLDQGQVKTMAGVLQNLTPKSEIMTPSALAEYGLDHPLIQITLSGEDKDTVLKVGDFNELISGYYLLCNDHVYTVDSAVKTAFSKSLCDLAVKEEIPFFDHTNAVTINKEGQETVLRYDEDGRDTVYSGAFKWFAESTDGTPPLDPRKTESYLAKLEVIWQKCVTWNATDEELRSFGLADDASSISIDYTDTGTADTGTKDANGNPIMQTIETDKVFRLLFGAEAEGGRYVRIAGSRMVYILASSDCEELLNASYESLKPASLLTVDWNEVTAFDLQMDGQAITILKDDDGWNCRGTALSDTLTSQLQTAITSLSLAEDTGIAEDEPLIKGKIYQSRKGFAELSFSLTPAGETWIGTFGNTQMPVSADAVQALRYALQSVIDSFASSGASQNSGG